MASGPPVREYDVRAMRAAILREYGQTPQVGDFPAPAAGDGQLLVRVLAAGLNPVDLGIASGKFYGGVPPLPCVVGREGVGETGDGRVVYFDGPVAPYGSFAEQALIAASSACELPEGTDPGLATCFGIAGLAAWLALEYRAHVQPGETVLVLGASGVVGQIAVQGAKLMGAGRVVAAARNAQALAHTLELGADATVAIGEVADLPAALRDACGGEGANVVIDPVWGEPAAAAIQACAPEGRVVQLGAAAGATSEIPSAAIRGRGLQIFGHSNFRVPDDVKHAAFRTMVAHAAAGRLTVQLERVPLDDVASAWERQRSSPRHKLVIVP